MNMVERHQVFKAILTDWDELDNPGEMVMASDYDALGVAHDGWLEQCTRLTDQRNAAYDRIAALEAVLRKILSEGDYTAPEGMKRIAREALGLTAETASKPAKDYPAWFGAPTLIDRIDESVERGIGLNMAIAECAQWAELRSEVVQQLRDYYQSKTKGEQSG
jgi:hypothetical protein